LDNEDVVVVVVTNVAVPPTVTVSKMVEVTNTTIVDVIVSDAPLDPLLLFLVVSIVFANDYFLVDHNVSSDHGYSHDGT